MIPWPTPDTMSHDEGTGKEEEGVDSAGVEGRSCREVSCREVSCREVSCREVSCREVSCREVCCEVSFSTNLAPTGKSGDCRRGGDDPMFATVWDVTKRLCTRVGGTCRWLARARSRRRVTSATAMSRFFSARWARFCMDFFPVVSCRTALGFGGVAAAGLPSLASLSLDNNRLVPLALEVRQRHN